MTPRLSDDERHWLLAVARESIAAFLEGLEVPLPDDRLRARTGLEPVRTGRLTRPGAAFVTLRVRTGGALRGCVGETEARRPLVDSVAWAAVAAATRDPRFPPVRAEELGDLSVEINALTPMHEILPDDVVVGRHGLMIERGWRVGLLLPEVPGELGWNRARFLEGVCLKAGLPPDAWRDPESRLLAFEAEAWGEDDG